jgi:hypothetical protein
MLSKNNYMSSAAAMLARLYGLNVVFTGGPNVGKTTHAKKMLLENEAVLTPEMAQLLLHSSKEFIDHLGLQLPTDPSKVDPELVRLFTEHRYFHPLVNNDAFQPEIFRRSLDQERLFAARILRAFVIMDRSYLDNFAYCKFYGVEVPEEFRNVKPIPAERIDICFLFHSFGGFEDNGVRVESVSTGADFAKAIGPLLGDTYRDAGVNVIEVPVIKKDTIADSIEARHRFIWDQINEYAERKLVERRRAA